MSGPEAPSPLPSSIAQTANMLDMGGSLMPSPMNYRAATHARPGETGTVHDMAEQINWMNVPMNDIPPTSLFAGGIGEALKNTSGHEIAHTALAVIHGVPVKYVSVNPGKDYLGVTVFGGHVPKDKLKPIAAASSVLHLFGEARGYGGDFMQIAMADYEDNMVPGSSIGQAQNEARAALTNNFSGQELKNMALILAFCRVLGADSIGPMIARAKFEAKLQSEGKIHLLEEAYRQKNGKIPAPVVHEFDPAKEKGEYTILEPAKDGYKVKYYTDGQKVAEGFICRFCGAINGHSPECVAVKNIKTVIPANSKEEPMDDERVRPEQHMDLVPENNPSIPTDGIIFERSKKRKPQVSVSWNEGYTEGYQEIID